MTLRRPRFLLGVQAALWVSLASAPARAQITKQECADANLKAQESLNDHKLTAAREKLRACADEACPAPVRSDCTQMLAQLDQAQPTVVFHAKDESGNDLSAVTVTVDGKPLAVTLAGSALRVDPGSHEFVFTASGKPPVIKRYVVSEGDKGRLLEIQIGAPSPPAPIPPSAPGRARPSAPPAPTAVIAPPPDETGARKVVGIVAGGAGVVGVVLGGVFGELFLSASSQQQTDCVNPGKCSEPVQAASDHSRAETARAVSAVAFIGGGTLLAGGVLLLLTSGPPSDHVASTGVTAAPSVGPGTAGLLLRGAF